MEQITEIEDLAQPQYYKFEESSYLGGFSSQSALYGKGEPLCHASSTESQGHFIVG